MNDSPVFFSVQKSGHDQPPDPWLRKVFSFISQEVYNPELSVNWLAGEFHLSERQFARLVSQKSGHPVSYHIRGIKLQTARAALSNGTYKTVKEMAFALNFNDTKYFSRLFFDYHGFYPSDLL